MRVRPRLQGYLDRAGQLVVSEAGKLWMRHHGPFERLADLTAIAASPQEPTYLFSTRDLIISPEVFSHSGYEEDELRWVLDYLEQPQARRTVIEVGANIGTTTIPLLVRHGAAHVEAFEPDPFNYDLLRCNLILNHVDDRVETHPLAISDTNGEVMFEQCHWNQGDHRVRVNGEAAAGLFGEGERATIPVPARRLDDAVTTPLDAVGLIWVDAQGHEAHILEGAPQILSRPIPWAIEYWPYGLSRQGGLARLNRAIATRFSQVVDVRQSLRQGRAVLLDAADLDAVASELGNDFTDLILIPEPPADRSS
jgi:FkbM family methyltransferase